MGQEFSSKPNFPRYAERYHTKYSGYFYAVSIIGILLAIGGFVYRHKIPDGMFRSTAVIQFIVTTSLLSYLFHLKGKYVYGVRIAGATGSNADLINGWYEPTEEMSGGMCVYEKIGDHDTCLEYNDKLMKWQVKPVECKGKPNCRASCKVPSKCLPEECPGGIWVNGSTTQSTITIRRASDIEIKNEAKKHEIQVTEDTSSAVAAALKAKAAQSRAMELQAMKAAMSQPTKPGSIRLSGATGDTESIINGIYEPSIEITHIDDTIELPVYFKLGDPYTCMEYFQPRNEWQIKGTFSRGANICFASCVVVNSASPCLPVECPQGKWKVDNGEKWITQPSVTVTAV